MSPPIDAAGKIIVSKNVDGRCLVDPSRIMCMMQYAHIRRCINNQSPVFVSFHARNGPNCQSRGVAADSAPSSQTRFQVRAKQFPSSVCIQKPGIGGVGDADADQAPGSLAKDNFPATAAGTPVFLTVHWPGSRPVA